MITLIGEHLYQWDSNRCVEVSQPVDEVHFYNSRCGDALVVKPTTVDGVTTAPIPNILLQEAYKIYVCPVTEDQTLSRTVLTVRQRQKPADYVYTETEVMSYQALEKRIMALESADPTVSATPAKIGEVTLLASAWTGTGNLFSQIVTIDGVTENSQVDLTPNVVQLAVFYEKDLAFVTENEDGVVTVYAIGQKPQNDYTIQVTITEVAYA